MIPLNLEAWELCLLECLGCFVKPEPRLDGASLMYLIPPMANASSLLHYRPGN